MVLRFILFDRWGYQLAQDLQPLSAVRTRSLDGTDTLTLTITGQVDKGQRIVMQDQMGRWRE